LNVPTYEYECPKCPRVFEIRQRISEKPLETCDVCGGPVHRLLSASTFILKGGGWYVTDYPSESRKKAMKAESSSSTGAESSTGSANAPSSSGTSSGGASNGAGSSSASKGEGGKSGASKSEGTKSEGSKPESGKSKPSKKPSD
jgi:putative FmdB family regulatory protein